MRNPLSKKIVDIQPSGIRKFFDVANEMKDAILTHHGGFVRKEFSLWREDAHSIRRMQD